MWDLDGRGILTSEFFFGNAQIGKYCVNGSAKGCAVDDRPVSNRGEVAYTQDVISSVILVGFMGAGKTTVGRLLAQRLKRRFVDLDDRIREREGRTIPDIFRNAGEEHFRRVEAECLRELIAEKEPVILALGGGAFVQENNAELIKAAKIPVIFLDGAPEELFRRCATEAGARPLAGDENQFRQLYESRREGYMRAGVRVDTTALSPEQVAAEIARRLDLTGYS